MILTGISWQYQQNKTTILYEQNGKTEKIELDGIISHNDCIKKFNIFRKIIKRHEKSDIKQ